MATLRGGHQGPDREGKLADHVILDKGPTAVDPETPDQIKVVETIKEGITVFEIGDGK